MIRNRELTNRKIKTQRKMFEKISEDMIAKGFNVTVSIVENRFKWCRKTFFKLRKNCETTGHE